MGTHENGLKLILLLAVSDLDDVDKLQEKLVSFFLEITTQLAQEKLKEHLGISGVIAGLFAAVGQHA